MPRALEFDTVRPFMDGPQCPCGAVMWLDHIERVTPDHDKRIFECPRCQHVEAVVVRIEITSEEVP